VLLLLHVAVHVQEHMLLLALSYWKQYTNSQQVRLMDRWLKTKLGHNSEKWIGWTYQPDLSGMVQGFFLTTKQHQPAYQPQKPSAEHLYA
jgi:hypothetical protein